MLIKKITELSLKPFNKKKKFENLKWFVYSYDFCLIIIVFRKYNDKNKNNLITLQMIFPLCFRKFCLHIFFVL